MRKMLLLAGLSGGLAGCTALTVGKPTRGLPSEPMGIPEIWTQAGKGNDGKISTGWLATFQDAEMSRLVDEAMRYNNDLRVSASRLRQAREGMTIGRSGRLPSFGASTSGSRSGSRFQGGTRDLSAWEQSTSYGLSFNASWELDLWGRLRDLEEASVHEYISERANFRAARLSLAANTAGAWCDLITNGLLVESAEQTLQMFITDLEIKEGNYKAGDENSSSLDVKFGKNNVASAQRSLNSRELSLENTARLLEVLIGRYPSATIEHRSELPKLPSDVPAGLPSELLMRRPDLIVAQANVMASAARADAARKSLLPSITLSGRGSSSSDQLINLIDDPESIVWNVASSLSQTIFRGGAPTAQAKQALERNRSAIDNFVSVALRAFQEVESALANERSLAEQQKHVQTELNTAIEAERQAEQEIAQNLVTPLQLLEAQRRVINARNSAISLQNQRLQNRINLHLALGGDFETVAPEPFTPVAAHS